MAGRLRLRSCLRPRASFIAALLSGAASQPEGLGAVPAGRQAAMATLEKLMKARPSNPSSSSSRAAAAVSAAASLLSRRRRRRRSRRLSRLAAAAAAGWPCRGRGAAAPTVSADPQQLPRPWPSPAFASLPQRHGGGPAPSALPAAPFGEEPGLRREQDSALAEAARPPAPASALVGSRAAPALREEPGIWSQSVMGTVVTSCLRTLGLEGRGARAVQWGASGGTRFQQPGVSRGLLAASGLLFS